MSLLLENLKALPLAVASIAARYVCVVRFTA